MALFRIESKGEMMGDFPNKEDSLPQGTRKRFGLTSRELDVLRILATKGLTNEEIARELVVSKKTIDYHIENILSKLRVTNRVQAVIKAIDEGLVK